MIKWKSIKEVGMPKDATKGYLVTDGESIEYSDLDNDYNNKWIGGSVYALYEEVSGTYFDFYPTHYYPVSKLNLP